MSTTTKIRTWPTPYELAIAPELALLALLDNTLEIAFRALVAVHPALEGEPPPYWIDCPSPGRTAAQTIVTIANRLSVAIVAYRDAISSVDASQTDDHYDEFPF